MIGFFAGFGLLFSYLGAAWTVDTSEGSLFSAGLGGAFAILGVPLRLPAISIAAAIEIGIFKMVALRSTIVVSNSVV